MKFPKISFCKTLLNLSIRNSATSNLFLHLEVSLVWRYIFIRRFLTIFRTVFVDIKERKKHAGFTLKNLKSESYKIFNRTLRGLRRTITVRRKTTKLNILKFAGFNLQLRGNLVRSRGLQTSLRAKELLIFPRDRWRIF